MHDSQQNGSSADNRLADAALDLLFRTARSRNAWLTRPLPELFPSRDMRAVFVGNEVLIEETAKRNSTLQGAYLMMAARSLGLDCGPMSGFNAGSLDAELFPDGRWKSNFLCAIGYGSDEKLFPRNPRLDFAEACLDL